MVDRSKIAEFLKDFGWKGVLAGFLISVLLQPFAVSWATQAYVAVGAPGFERPEVNTTYDGIATIYEPGQEIPDYEGLEWESDYEVVRFTIENPSNRYLRDVQVYLPLPSCSVYTNSQGPSVSGDYQVNDLHTARIQSTRQIHGERYSCSKKIDLGTMSPNEKASVEFVIRQKFDKCDKLLGISPGNRYYINYRWQERNVLFEETKEVNISEVSDFDLRDLGTFLESEPATQIGPQSVEGLEMEVWAMILGVDNSSYEGALKQCQVRSGNNSTDS